MFDDSHGTNGRGDRQIPWCLDIAYWSCCSFVLDALSPIHHTWSYQYLSISRLLLARRRAVTLCISLLCEGGSLFSQAAGSIAGSGIWLPPRPDDAWAFQVVNGKAIAPDLSTNFVAFYTVWSLLCGIPFLADAISANSKTWEMRTDAAVI